MPMSKSFENRLYPVLKDIVESFSTPFHIYDEAGIRQTGQQLIRAFESVKGFKEFFAVKALPNPRILQIMKEMGFGFDCSSIPELLLCRQIGSSGDELMFTSNNTTHEEFSLAATDGGSILNLDDITFLDKLRQIPELICFRYNPGSRRTGDSIIGNPEESKYGVAHDQLMDAYSMARERGARRFGLHTMLASNELDHTFMIQTTGMLLEICEWLKGELGIFFEFINIGGGLGIPYRPEDAPFKIEQMGAEVAGLYKKFKDRNGYVPRFFMESGRFMTGPHGALVVTAINRKDTYRTYVGVDACMSSLMRPAMYGAYHHITVPDKDGVREGANTVDVVGALCENNDKFAIQRTLPEISEGDLLVIHDTGAHGHAMGFNYNGRLRPKELLLREDGKVELIRREERIEDHFATLQFEPKIISPVP